MRKWRKMSWAIIVWTVLMFVWIASGLANASNVAAENCTGAYSDACQAGVGLGTGIGVVMLGGLWFIGFIVLSIVWFMRRPKEA